MNEKCYLLCCLLCDNSRSLSSRAVSFTHFKSRRCSPLFLCSFLVRGPPILSIKKIERSYEVDKRPIRRKFRDNPYLLESIKEKNIYIIKFNDINGKHEVVVDKDIFDLFDKNEKYENARYFEYSKHLFHNEINYSQIKSNYSLEDEVINNLSLKELKYTIEMLPDIQKRRIKKYYFEEKTLEEIAMEEGCSKVAIKYSIDSALRKISKIFKI